MVENIVRIGGKKSWLTELSPFPSMLPKLLLSVGLPFTKQFWVFYQSLEKALENIEKRKSDHYFLLFSPLPAELKGTFGLHSVCGSLSVRPSVSPHFYQINSLPNYKILRLVRIESIHRWILNEKLNHRGGLGVTASASWVGGHLFNPWPRQTKVLKTGSSGFAPSRSGLLE